MNRNLAKYFFTIVFFFAIACSSSIKACPAQLIQTVNTEAVVFGTQQVPNTELERVHPPTVPGGQIAVQKNIVCSDLLTVAAFHRSGIASGNRIIKASSLLIKDQLTHNYPSHNFW